METTDWSKYKVAELKEECKKRGIPLTGLKLKQQFIDKLEEVVGAPPEVEAQYAAQDKDEKAAEKAAEYNAAVGEAQPAQPAEHGAAVGEAQPGLAAQPAQPAPAIDEEAVKRVQEPEPGFEKAQLHPQIRGFPVQRVPVPEAGIEKARNGENGEGFSALGAASDAQVDADVDKINAAAAATEDAAQTPSPAQEVQNDRKDENGQGAQIKDQQEMAANDFGREPTALEDEAGHAQHDAPMHGETHPAVEDPGRSGEATNNNNEDVEMHDAKDQVLKGEVFPSTPSKQAVTQSAISTPGSAVPPTELVEDQKKRKRRSKSPAPDAREMAQKRARLEEEAAASKATEAASIEQLKVEVEAQHAEHDPAEMGEGDEVSEVTSKVSHRKTEPLTTDKIQEVEETMPEVSPSRKGQRSTSPTMDRDVDPALHFATCSIYIRNFKRPLHIPTLRSHIVSLAKSSSNSDADPLKLFYLDPIRTHAFITFNSISEASRVRTAMHDTRFPDEPLREPLFVDFVPDEGVQSWIDQESSNRGKRWEVFYDETDSGIAASLQDAESRRAMQKRPMMQQSQSRGRTSQTPQIASAPTNVHPERAAILPRASSSKQQNEPAHKDEAKGFKALDELFSHTTAKPKLYYKSVLKDVADERLDKIQDLRVGHGEMGRSGAPDMKRYTFELHKGKEEWVDKGPEFGYGRKGQDRLAGAPRGRGGFRGGGGGRYMDRDRPMDSYRGR